MTVLEKEKEKVKKVAPEEVKNTLPEEVKKEPFVPVEFEINRDLLSKIIASHKKFVGHYECNALTAFNFVLKQNILKVFTTDGNRALKSKIEVNNITKKDIIFNIDSTLIEKLVIFKSELPCISVKVDENTITFNDYAIGVIQTYKLVKHKYPDVEKLIDGYDYKERNYSIGLNKLFFSDLSVLKSNDRTNIVELNMNKENNLQPVVVKTGGEELKQVALLMPILVKR